MGIKKYMIQMNLSGLHRKIYKKTKKYNLDKWSATKTEVNYDSSGNICWTNEDRFLEGMSQLVFKSRKEAKLALKGAEMVCDFLINVLSDSKISINPGRD